MCCRLSSSETGAEMEIEAQVVHLKSTLEKGRRQSRAGHRENKNIKQVCGEALGQIFSIRVDMHQVAMAGPYYPVSPGIQVQLPCEDVNSGSCHLQT